MRVTVVNRYDDSVTCVVELVPGGSARVKPGASKAAKEWLRGLTVYDADGPVTTKQGARYIKALHAMTPDSKLEA